MPNPRHRSAWAEPLRCVSPCGVTLPCGTLWAAPHLVLRDARTSAAAERRIAEAVIPAQMMFAGVRRTPP